MSGRTTALLPPVQGIHLVDEIVRDEAVKFRSTSTPFHLLHITLSGEVKQWAEGRPEQFGPGDVIWYHNAEAVEGEILAAPWRFITISFDAASIAPPPDDQRVWGCAPSTIPLAFRLLEQWRDPGGSELERALVCTALLSELILEFVPQIDLTTTKPAYPMNAHARWWETEKQLRYRMEDPLDLAAIAQLAGMSERTLNRACKAASGMSPVRRFRELKMLFARGVLQHTDLSVTEIAFRVGYERVQEFSRDFKKWFGQTPREARVAGPDYQQLQRHRPGG